MQGISVHLYQVVPHDPKKSAPLEKLIERIGGKPHADRIRNVGHSEVRLEAIDKTGEGYLLMDFVRLRFESGPGRADRKKEIEGFHFSPGEGFGEETAALYDPSTQHMIVQYNQHGVRSGRIAEYLSNIDSEPVNQYELEPRFEPHIEHRLARKHIVRAFRFRIATRHLHKVDRDAGVSLTDSLKLGGHFDAETIDVTLRAARAKRSSSLNLDEFRRAYRWLRQRIGVDEHSVDAAFLIGKDDPDSKAEQLNLLGHRLKETFTDLSIDADLRYPREQRWSALLRARGGWDKVLKTARGR